jgi:hypothetical protein
VGRLAVPPCWDGKLLAVVDGRADLTLQRRAATRTLDSPAILAVFLLASRREDLRRCLTARGAGALRSYWPTSAMQQERPNDRRTAGRPGSDLRLVRATIRSDRHPVVLPELRRPGGLIRRPCPTRAPGAGAF